MKKILLVDDDHEVSRSIISLFDSGKFHVTHIDSGEGAESFFKTNGDVDVVMLDVNLPAMSGLELLKKIRAKNDSLPVIVISGNVSTDNAIEAMREGMGLSLGAPIYAYKVYVEDGREELVRGLEFLPVQTRILKRILAGGRERKVHNSLSPLSMSIISPAILLEELELTRNEQEFDKPPILASPATRTP